LEEAGKGGLKERGMAGGANGSVRGSAAIITTREMTFRLRRERMKSPLSKKDIFNEVMVISDLSRSILGINGGGGLSGRYVGQMKRTRGKKTLLIIRNREKLIKKCASLLYERVADGGGGQGKTRQSRGKKRADKS